MNAFKSASVFFIISAVIAELFCATFSTVFNYWLLNLDGVTEGIVTKSETYLANGAYQSVLTYDIEYEYKVDGSRYRNSQVTHGRSDENPYKIVRRYPVGKRVTVHYASSKPGFSLLEITGLSWKTYRQLGALVFVFVWTFIWISRENRQSTGESRKNLL